MISSSKNNQNLLVIVQNRNPAVKLFGFTQCKVSNGDVIGNINFSHVGPENFYQAFNMISMTHQQNARVLKNAKKLEKKPGKGSKNQ